MVPWKEYGIWGLKGWYILFKSILLVLWLMQSLKGDIIILVRISADHVCEKSW